MLIEFISNTKLLVNTLGYKIFDSLEDSSMKRQNNRVNFYIKAVRGADAKGIVVSDGFAVLKGSSIATTTVRSLPDNLIQLRANLIKKGIITSEFQFAKDHIFTSPSLAATVVMGRSANGRTEWKTADGKSLKSIEEENLR